MTIIILIVTLSIIGMAGVVTVDYDEGYSILFNLIWLITALYCSETIITLISFTFKHNRQIMAGTLAGFSIGITPLGTTCFVTLCVRGFH